MDSNELIGVINAIKPKVNKVPVGEVKALLYKAVDALQAYENQIGKCNVLITDLRKKEAEYEAQMSDIKESVINAELMSQQIVDEANKKAEEITSKAVVEANNIIAEAKKSASAENEKLIEDTTYFRSQLEQMRYQVQNLQNNIKRFIEDSGKE